MLPETLDQEVIESSKEQFENIAALFKRSDIQAVVIATDAGREGELVARWILKLVGWKGETLRLWISSQTEKAIREGFAHLESAGAVCGTSIPVVMTSRSDTPENKYQSILTAIMQSME